MKIGFDGKRFFHNASGLGNYSRDLLRILARYLPENEYVLFNRKDSDGAQEVLSFPNVSFSPLTPGLFARQLQMGRDAGEAHCDIFHGLSGELPLRWGKRKIRKVVTIHDLIFEILPHYYSYVDRRIHFVKFRQAAEAADRVVAISEQTKADIMRLLNIPERKIQVIYQGCSSLYKKSYTEQEKDAVRHKYKLPPAFVLNVGTLEDRKNGLSLVKAINGTAIPLIFIGKETAYTQKIRKYIEENRLSGQVIFLKNVSNEDLAIIYRLATIFAYPSVYEGFGIPVIEALYSGVPVITNAAGVFQEAGGPHSRYVQVEDERSIRPALMDLWDNHALRSEMALKGREYARRFDDDKIALAWKNLYTALV